MLTKSRTPAKALYPRITTALFGGMGNLQTTAPWTKEQADSSKVLRRRELTKYGRKSTAPLRNNEIYTRARAMLKNAEDNFKRAIRSNRPVTQTRYLTLQERIEMGNLPAFDPLKRRARNEKRKLSK
jgi:hypothetical protein